ncbi:unnamed protein product, partial [Callosobruchus maculatus]
MKKTHQSSNLHRNKEGRDESLTTTKMMRKGQESKTKHSAKWNAPRQDGEKDTERFWKNATLAGGRLWGFERGSGELTHPWIGFGQQHLFCQ